MSKHGFFTKWIRLVIAAVIATPIALQRSAAAASPRLPSSSAVDDAGPDDEPGQKDLNALSVDYGDPGATAIDVTWNWDDTSTTGANTRDGCALFDTDGDGFANYSLCLTVDSDETADSLALRLHRRLARRSLWWPDPDLTFRSTPRCRAGGPDPFARRDPAHADDNDCDDRPGCLTVDTVADAHINLSDVGGGVAKLINVCSYPSRGAQLRSVGLRVRAQQRLPHDRQDRRRPDHRPVRVQRVGGGDER